MNCREIGLACLYCVCVCGREREKESMISVHKQVENMEIVVIFYPITCYIYLLNVFWGFGSFSVVDSHNKNIIYLFIVFGPPWTSEHRHVPRMPVRKSGPEFTFTFTFNHLADAFIQSDVQMRRTIEAIRPSREQQYTSAMTSLS